MAKVLAITDLKGALLAVLRADPIEAAPGLTIQAVPTPMAEHHQRHHLIDVPDHLIGKRGTGVEELHHEVSRRLPRR
jgi:hypothetical protein